MKLYGLSLGFCVRDMVEQKISVDEVECIIAATNIVTVGDLRKVIDVYATTLWEGLGIEARRIAVELFLEQKVFQPRKEGLPVHGISNYMNCFWVEVE